MFAIARSSSDAEVKLISRLALPHLFKSAAAMMFTMTRYALAVKAHSFQASSSQLKVLGLADRLQVSESHRSISSRIA